MSPRQMTFLVVAAVLTIMFIPVVFMSYENVDADDILVIQSPMAGTLTWHTTPGIKWQGFGKCTKYSRRSIYKFQIPVRFNDGGHANMHGSIQYEMPLDNENLTALHLRFGHQEAIQKQLVETVTHKSVFMTGPLMSSKESYAERRNALIHFVEDQVSNGVYKTIQRDIRTKDAMTDVDKTATIVEIVMNNSIPERQEEAVLTRFGIRAFNFAITEMIYDEAVEGQIKKQQEITMSVQTAIADAKKAEQNAITIKKQGEADAARSKWEQEVKKATAVVLAQQEKEVAELDAAKKLAVAKLEREAAEQTKQREILLGEGESKRRELVMAADGALDKKLQAYIEVQAVWANAMSNYNGNIVPTIIMGGQGGNTSGPTTLIDLLTAKAARDLVLDLDVNKK